MSACNLQLLRLSALRVSQPSASLHLPCAKTPVSNTAKCHCCSAFCNCLRSQPTRKSIQFWGLQLCNTVLSVWCLRCAFKFVFNMLPLPTRRLSQTAYDYIINVEISAASLCILDVCRPDIRSRQPQKTPAGWYSKIHERTYNKH